MKRITFFLIAFLLLFFPGSALAKGKTVKITIENVGLRAPIEITDPHALAPFNVWAGPNPAMGASPPSFVVDWSSGTVRAPSRALPRYKVSLWTTDREKVTYVVFYAYDPVTKHGYVCLPGEQDDSYHDSYRLNVGTMLRGVEGNWFHAWSEWDRIAIPLISGHA